MKSARRSLSVVIGINAYFRIGLSGCREQPVIPFVPPPVETCTASPNGNTLSHLTLFALDAKGYVWNGKTTG
jgi:hypothetical protein